MGYSEKVMEHFMHPRNVGRIEDTDGVGRAGNPICGDILTIYIKVKDNVITDVKFETFGCGAAIATSSMVTELVKGKAIEEALTLRVTVADIREKNKPPLRRRGNELGKMLESFELSATSGANINGRKKQCLCTCESYGKCCFGGL